MIPYIHSHCPTGKRPIQGMPLWWAALRISPNAFSKHCLSSAYDTTRMFCSSRDIRLIFSGDPASNCNTGQQVGHKVHTPASITVKHTPLIPKQLMQLCVVPLKSLGNVGKVMSIKL